MHLLSANLARDWVAERRRQIRWTVTGLVAIAVLLLATGGTYLFFHWRIAHLQRQLAALRGKESQYAAEVARVEELKAAQAILQPWVDKVQEVHAADRTWRLLLTELAALVPPDLWLTRVEVQPREEMPSPPGSGPGRRYVAVTIEGNTFNYEALGLFWRRLVRSPRYAGVKLRRSRVVGQAKRPYIAFELAGELAGASSPPADTPPPAGAQET
ncbi:MAG TPA: hypothetical protein EYP85_06985 [Armatimonadetes bacterium]|nr:hypothetical protein [Armatimonadota bacterium]